MAKLLKLRRGTTTQHASFTGAEGELTVDTTKDTAVVHDGSQAGGRPLAREDMSNVSSANIAGQLGTDSIATSKIAAGALPTDVTVASANLVDGTIVNADVNISAAIAGSKISPNFGSQDITTTGKIQFANVYSNEADLPSASTYHGMFAHVHSTGLAYFAHAGNWIKLAKLDAPDFTGGIDVTGTVTTTGDIVINSDGPKITLNDTGQNPDYDILNTDGVFQVNDTTNGAIRWRINTDGHVDVTGNLDVGAGVDVTGNITCTGTVDGRDVAADGTKLDGIESGATADQTKSDIDALNINADQVDGLHGSQFVRSDTNDTMSGNLTVNGAITSTGTLTVMNTQNSSDIYMADSDDTTRRIHGNSNRVGFLQSNDAWGAYCDNSGNWVAAGNVTAYSDQRLKTDISTINDALGIVGKLRGVSYKWLKDGSDSIGVIAQEVEKVLPEVVVTGEGVNPVTQEIEEIKSVDYGKIVGVLINAINELKEEVEELKNAKITG